MSDERSATSQSGPVEHDELVLVLAPTGRDSPLTCALLEERAGIRCAAVDDVIELCDRIREGSGAIVIAEEALDATGVHRLTDTLSAQLPWSDLPVLVLTSGAVPTSAGLIAVLRQRGNVTILDRPVRIVTLVSAVQSALRARRRQYEVRDLLTETRNAIRQRDQFLAMLGHELRNPLATVTNAMSVLDGIRAPADDVEAEQREIIRRQNEHLARLVDDLLDVARITSGKISLHRRPIDLGELATRAVRAVELSARAHEHELIINCPSGDDRIMIQADPVRMEQVINNLLTNALKYTPRGGRIEVTVKPSGTQEAELRVCDNGIGIPPELLHRVFDLFAQAEPALDRAQGGLGIGLTLVRALVQMHDGQVAIHSDGPNCGTEVGITLPRLQAQASKPQAAPLAARADVNGNGHAGAARDNNRFRRVLVIEDQADARRALQRLLQVWGHEVATAEDGFRGVELATRQPPDVALVDVGLPGLDGYEVARRIRAALGDRVHLVALTGYGQPEDRERAYNAGFNVHLIKPVDRDQLTHALAGGVDADRLKN